MNNSWAALWSAAVVRCLSLATFHTAAWSVLVFQFVPWAGRRHLGWKATLTSALQLDASPCFCVPQCPLPLPNLPVCVNKAKVNWVQAKCLWRACSSLEKNNAGEEMKSVGLQLSRVLLMIQHSGYFDLDFDFWGTQEWHTQTMSNERAAVIWEDCWGHQSRQAMVEAGWPMGTSNKKMISEWYPFSCPAEENMPHPFSLLSKHWGLSLMSWIYSGSLNPGTVLDFSIGYVHFLKQFYKVGIIPVSEIEKERDS